MKLTLTDIGKAYGDKDVLKGISLVFRPGAVHALMGPNGCGKSTLLRIASLLERPDSGEVIYTDASGNRIEDAIAKRRITLLLPGVGVFDTTVFGNVAFGLGIRGLRGAELKEKVYAALSSVGLLEKAGQKALSLSSGEAQRLGLARAMAIGPDVLFLDEPTSNVDSENTAIIERLIAGMKEAGRPTVVMATHEREQAERLADEILYVEAGRLLSF